MTMDIFSPTVKVELWDGEVLPPEGDIQDDLSDDSDEETIEVEIGADDIDELVQELKLIKGLETEITCAYESIAEVVEDEEEDDEQEEQQPMEDFVTYDDPMEEDFEELVPDVVNDEENEPKIKEFDLKIHRLDSFLLKKFKTAEKKFLRSRFLSHLIYKQEQSEKMTSTLVKPMKLEDGSFMCHKCMNIYQSRRSLKRHLNEFHERSRLSPCDKCDYVGSSPGALRTHILINHLGLTRYKCPHCDHKSNRRSIVVSHVIKVHGMDPEEANSAIKSTLRQKNRGIGESHQCPQCDYNSPSKFTLKKHLEKKHGTIAEPDQEAFCRLCQEEFLSKEVKERHPCPVKLKANEALRDLQTDPEDGKHHCPACSDSFSLLVALKDHYMRFHVDVKGNGGNKNIPSVVSLENDSKEDDEDLPSGVIDTGDGGFLCDQCAFIGSKEDLAWHIKQIHKDRIHKCDHCLFSTNSTDVLSNHIKRVHEGIASHMCHLCSTACWNVKELGEHLKAEHFEKTKHFFCTQPECEFWARQRNRLDKHVQRVHLRQKNFLCDKCEFRAFIQPELDAHIREKHLKIFRFNCHLCHRDGIRMGFATRKRLYRHFSFAHNVNPASEDIEANAELIRNPPPLDPTLTNDDKKSKRGRRKGAKNRLKLDPDTGQLVRTLMKRPRKSAMALASTTSNGLSVQKKTKKVSSSASASAASIPRSANVILPPTTAAAAASASTATSTIEAAAAAASAAAAAILLNEHNASSSLWWPPTFAGGNNGGSSNAAV